MVLADEPAALPGERLVPASVVLEPSVTAPDDWIPLYTNVGLQHYLPAALSAFQNQGVPSLIAVAPPDFHVSSDKEFLLSNFH